MAPPCSCARAARRASPRACAAVCAALLAYTLLGGFLFLALEGAGGTESAGDALPAPAPPAAALRVRTVERLWAITEDLNILYKENWTELAARELLDFQRALLRAARAGGDAPATPPHRWTFAGSFLYALTLITTIGHGDVAPQSAGGKMAAVLYACAGIPLVLLYLATLGSALARAVRALYWRLRPAASARALPAPLGAPLTPFEAALNLTSVGGARGAAGEVRRVPGALGALLLALYVALGAFVFRATEGWSLVDGCYFSFSSLATIGLGGLRPGGRRARGGAGALAACCAYILVGMAVVAGSFELVRERAGAAWRGAGACCAGRGVRAVHHAAEPVALAVLS